MGALLDALADRDDLDLDRIGALGVSLGGYYAPRAAAFEPRLKAVAGISGPYNMGECWDGVPAADARDLRGQVVRGRRGGGARARRASST